MRVRHQTSMFARRGVVVYAVYAPDSHLSFRFAAALYRVLQALSVDFSNVQLPKILGKFSVKSSTSNKVISGNWFTYTMVDSLFPSRWKPYPNPKYSNSANASTARRSSSWMELMSWMIISMLMLCLSKITCCLFVGLGVFALLGLGVGLPSPDWSLFFCLSDLGFQVGFPHSPALSQSEYGWCVLFTKTKNKMGHGFVLKDRVNVKTPLRMVDFQSRHTLISMVTKFTLWQWKKEINSDEDHEKKTTTTTIQSHPSTLAHKSAYFFW